MSGYQPVQWCGNTMWRWTLVWQAFSLIFVSGTLDFRFFTSSGQYSPTTEVNCIEVPRSTSDRLGRALTDGWRPNKRFVRSLLPSTTPTYPSELFYKSSVFKRIDRLLPEGADIVKEHAKLVQDINSLRQVMFFSPAFEDNRDYEDSIFHENIETSTTTYRPRLSSTKQPLRTTKDNSIPILLLGGNSNQRQVIKSPPLKFPKPTPVINLVGTSVSPLVKHPYPFVMQASSKNPIKVCMTSMPMLYSTTTRRPSLWERLIKAILPR